MSYFRRFVIGLTELILVLGIVVCTVFGAWAGRLLGKLYAASPYMPPIQGRPVMYVAGIHEDEFIGLLVGGALGFLLPAIAASLLFVFAKIQKSTRETAQTLRALRGEAPQPHL